MYVGRIVSIGKNASGKLCAMYRVSSRSFPNRKATENERGIAIVPKEGHENDVFKNPYIAYNCLRLTGSYAVATNGSHTDPVTEKLEAGMNMRDALVSALFGMDYEHDHLNTPRIAAIVDRETGKGALGIVRIDAVLVREFE
ncbi:MAG: IMP cyclohydrolase [Lentisphaerales bacterium]|nr:IMP cyclohydrolase [Lentisphaerales bacterium]